MDTVRLGKTELMVSRVGIGGIPIQRPPFDDAVRTIRRALDLGVSLIDTSRGYGDSEERIGAAIAGRRDQVIIATKGGWRDRTTAAGHIEESLKRLKTDVIDLWQFHGVNTLEGYEGLFAPGGAMEAAQAALQAGQIRHIGLSSHSPDVARKAITSGRVETIQIPFNLIGREIGEELAPLAREQDVGFIAMKPFAGGMLRKATLVIRYLLQFDHVVPIPGIERAAEIEEIVAIAERGPNPLTPKEREEIDEIRTALGTRFCRRCLYCMPCPQGVEIQPLMTLPVLWELWPPEVAFSEESIGIYVKRVVESAENCIQCGECESKCPYELSIREMIAEHVELYRRASAVHEAAEGG
jgi:aryl-alcohol dehydrogenase-like predicted oxidoreductase